MIKICNILSYQENQSHFWFNDGLISIEKEKKIFFFQLSIRPPIFFGTSLAKRSEKLKS